MADGTRLHRDSDSAASRTLPFGTVARVTNLGNGRSAVVTIRDRGPHGRGRIIDVSPATARQLGMVKSGTARVEVVVLRQPAASRRHPPGAPRRGGRAPEDAGGMPGPEGQGRAAAGASLAVA